MQLKTKVEFVGTIEEFDLELNEWILEVFAPRAFFHEVKWFVTKPTARQIRKFKKEAKQWL